YSKRSLIFRVFVLAMAAGAGLAAPALGQVGFGAQGPENAFYRRQVWLVPTPDPETASRAWLFRPAGNGPFPLAVIAHASTQNKIRRAQMAQPDYRALAGVLVTRGFAV